MAHGAPTPSGSSSCATPHAPPPAPPTATTSHWSPPTCTPHHRRSSPATPRAGPSRSPSPTSRPSSVSGRHATASRKPCNAPSRSGCSATASSSPGTRCTATTPTTPPTAAPQHPGTEPRPNHRPWTCSSNSDARSSPHDLCQQHPDQQQPKKSWKSSKPGHTPPHNRESREPPENVKEGQDRGDAEELVSRCNAAWCGIAAWWRVTQPVESLLQFVQRLACGRGT